MNVFSVMRLPDLLSIINALFGLGAVLASSQSPSLSAMMIFLAAVADGCDGFLARRMGAGVLGGSLDSLADVISFGVAPAALTVAILPAWEAMAASAIYMTCGSLRLARFNASPRDDARFEGLPITASGIVVAASILLGASQLALLLMLVLAGLMVSSIPYPKVRDLKLGAAFILLLTASALLVPFEAPYAAILILPAMTAYLVSPGVISCLQRER